MSTRTETESEPAKRRAARAVPNGAGALPTAPCSVVWSKGHAYVLEGFRARWVGVDDRGRPHALSGEQLQRRGWSRTRSH
ncbi:hypothetical protein [Saccharothrix australiensis]|uniref:Uncharacterized protein n=1 Tax=Saccharothrix australiensis TaxID=2072 RepID=A0A495W603_9PSEU|nr:hypothetical protein [Saccharothrix australiensis]RKT56550.1 hypothetical protein C8E97_5249 [Saccharothrix australiensis]